MDEIANYFGGRHNRGFVEGLNNRIKVIKRRCYGILKIDHLFQRIHLDLVGYSLFALFINHLQVSEITKEPHSGAPANCGISSSIVTHGCFSAHYI